MGKIGVFMRAFVAVLCGALCVVWAKVVPSAGRIAERVKKRVGSLLH